MNNQINWGIGGYILYGIGAFAIGFIGILEWAGNG